MSEHSLQRFQDETKRLLLAELRPHLHGLFNALVESYTPAASPCSENEPVRLTEEPIRLTQDPVDVVLGVLQEVVAESISEPAEEEPIVGTELKCRECGGTEPDSRFRTLRNGRKSNLCNQCLAGKSQAGKAAQKAERAGQPPPYKPSEHPINVPAGDPRAEIMAKLKDGPLPAGWLHDFQDRHQMGAAQTRALINDCVDARNAKKRTDDMMNGQVRTSKDLEGYSEDYRSAVVPDPPPTKSNGGVMMAARRTLERLISLGVRSPEHHKPTLKREFGLTDAQVDTIIREYREDCELEKV